MNTDRGAGFTNPNHSNEEQDVMSAWMPNSFVTPPEESKDDLKELQRRHDYEKKELEKRAMRMEQELKELKRIITQSPNKSSSKA